MSMSHFPNSFFIFDGFGTAKIRNSNRITKSWQLGFSVSRWRPLGLQRSVDTELLNLYGLAGFEKPVCSEPLARLIGNAELDIRHVLTFESAKFGVHHSVDCLGNRGEPAIEARAVFTRDVECVVRLDDVSFRYILFHIQLILKLIFSIASCSP